jgi:hypothetical protein
MGEKDLDREARERNDLRSRKKTNRLIFFRGFRSFREFRDPSPFRVPNALSSVEWLTLDDRFARRARQHGLRRARGDNKQEIKIGGDWRDPFAEFGYGVSSWGQRPTRRGLKNDQDLEARLLQRSICRKSGDQLTIVDGSQRERGASSLSLVKDQPGSHIEKINPDDTPRGPGSCRGPQV